MGRTAATGRASAEPVRFSWLVVLAVPASLQESVAFQTVFLGFHQAGNSLGTDSTETILGRRYSPVTSFFGVEVPDLLPS
jgi:hypothetical protein